MQPKIYASSLSKICWQDLLPWIRPLNKGITRSGSMSNVASHGLSFGNTLILGPYPMRKSTPKFFTLYFEAPPPHKRFVWQF